VLGEQIPLETMGVYTDNTYAFSVAYPDTFVARMQPAEQLAQFTPMPSAALRVMSPVVAASDLGDREPADLEIRVYKVGQIASLERWLTSNGLLSAGDTVQPFQAATVSGVEVCASTMLAPGCSYFVLGGGRIYQLTPATQEGEAMMDTFTLLP
jgi:hypothetical protein